ncbi:hypothetical protein cypCar_00012729 [Cyprinus carpio]|nr:hypothetical protein cypCar_00012729 [Cyprinus carpio]
MVTSKETRAAIIALHQNGLTIKEIATKNIAPERTIYRIIEIFNERVNYNSNRTTYVNNCWKNSTSFSDVRL